LPQDTTTPLPEEEPELLDSTRLGLPGSVSLDDSASFFEEPTAVVIEPDTTPGGLRPGPPQDTRPWIPAERDTLPLSGEWTADLREEPGSGVRMTTLQSVRTARNDGFDRIVFEFGSGRIPGYRIEFV